VSAAGIREAFAHNGSRRQPGRNSLEAIEPVSTERLPPAWIIHGDLLLQFPVATKRAERGRHSSGAAPLVVSVGAYCLRMASPVTLRFNADTGSISARRQPPRFQRGPQRLEALYEAYRELRANLAP